MASSSRLRFSLAELHVDILLLILEKVRSIQDFVAFGSVCKSWREAAINNKHRLCPQIPWMVLPDSVNNRLLCAILREESEEYTLTKSLNIPAKFEKPECLGLNYGWILTVSKEGEMNLVHPLSQSQIELPSMDSIYTLRAVLSSNPSKTSDFALTILCPCYSVCYGYRSLGHKRWSQIFQNIPSITNVDNYYGTSLSDLTYYEDRLYAVDTIGRVWSLGFWNRSILDDPKDSILVADLRIPPYSARKIYIVGSQENLLVVVRRNPFRSRRMMSLMMRRRRVPIVDRKWMHRFEVYKLDLINGEHKRITSLGDKAIFVGHNTTTTIFEVSGGLIKGNHIYYNGDDNYSTDVSLYCHRLEDGVSKVLKVPTALGTEKTTPFWYMPSLQF